MLVSRQLGATSQGVFDNHSAVAVSDCHNLGKMTSLQAIQRPDPLLALVQFLLAVASDGSL